MKIPISKYPLFFLLFIRISSANAQVDSVKKLSISGYAEIYYSYDFANPVHHEKENFLYNHKRHNEINANLILIRTAYSDKSIRANLGLMAGNYAQYNLSAEPTWAQFLYEATIGFKLSHRHQLWLDAGIMPSHIGFESAISADCWTLTRSLLAENSPYYESGIRLSWSNNKNNLSMAFLLLNGWQRISKPNYSQYPSIGFQVNYKPSDNVILNYSNFIGTAQPDSLNALRVFHNLYMQFMHHRKFGFIVGLDIGTDKFNTTDYGYWFSPIMIVKYVIKPKITIAARGEYYQDKNGIIISDQRGFGFQILGLSANVDYTMNEKIKMRLEGKMYSAEQGLFSYRDHRNYCVTTNLTVQL